MLDPLYFLLTNSQNTYIQIFMIYIIQHIIQHNKYFLSYIFLFINKIFSSDKKEIVIESQISVTDRCGMRITKFIYSKTFQAITYYIKKTNPNGIFKKREPDKTEKEHNPVFDLFIPDQTKPFLIHKDKQIYCSMKLYEDIFETNKDKAEINKKHIIKLFSNYKNTQINDIEDFIDMCLIYYNKYNIEKTITEQYYFCFINSEDNGETIRFNEKIFNTNRTFDTIFFEDKFYFLQQIDFFLNNEDWYIKKGIPYHLGILLHGIPGCGKTSIIKALLHKTKRNAVVIPLQRIKTCGELENIFYENELNHKNIPTNKRIYIFEDIDCLCDIIKERNDDMDEENTPINSPDSIKSFFEMEVINKLVNEKKNNDPEDELNLSFILNLFDGILEMPGRIIILTSNYPDKIDKALLRHGRIDIKLELKNASVDIIYEILSSFYLLDNEQIKNICIENNYQLKNNLYTPAYIVNVCRNNLYNIDNCLKVLCKKN